MAVEPRDEAGVTAGTGVVSQCPEVSIVIPAFNERQRLPGTLAAIYTYLARSRYTAEVIVVDDGSTDGTPEWVRAATSRYPRLRLLENGRNRGKGFSVKHGVLQSRGRFVLFSDADLSTPIEEADRLLESLEEGCDVVLGSRVLDPHLLERPQPWLRRQVGKAFHELVRAALGLPFRDTQCGFKAFRRQAALDLFARQRIEGFGFDVEILWLAHHRGLHCRELPVRWLNDTRTRVSVLRHGPRMLWEVLQIRWRGRAGTLRQEPHAAHSWQLTRG